MSDLEDILDHIGSFGRFQILLIIIVNISDATGSWGMLIMTLAGAVPDWWCPAGENVESSTSVNNSTIVYSTVATPGNSTKVQYCPADGSLCPNITYSDEFSSLVSEWNLVCNRQWAAGIITTIQMIGVMLGALIAGQLGDYIGRKKSFFLLYTLLLVTNLVTAFSNSVEMYTAMRFFVGISTGGVLLTSFTIPVEYIGEKYRVFSNVTPFWAFGMMIMAVLAYFIRDWRMQAIAVSIMGLPYLLSWWFIPESARWLMVHGKFQEAEEILSKIAKINKKPPLDPTKLKVLELFAADDLKERDNKQNYSLLDLLRSCKYLKKTLILVLIWFCCGLVYYGLSFGVKNLQGDRYVNLAITGAIDIPSYSAPFINYKLGRRRTSILFLILSTLASFGIPILWATGNFQAEMVTALSLVAKFAINGSWMVIMLFTSEHYPTVVRNIGSGVCNAASRVGAMVAPILAELHLVSPIIPYITFGSASVIAIVCILMLDETKNQHMPDYLPPNKKRKQLPDKKDICEDTDDPSTRNQSFAESDAFETKL